MDTYTDKYLTTPDKMLNPLRKYGVAIVPQILTKAECKKLINQTWTDLEYATSAWKTPILRNNEETWSMSSFSLMHGMLSQHHSIGHWPAAWYVRQHPEVAKIFGLLWNCEPPELLTSFDGVSISLPPETVGKGWFRPNSLWLHSDTSYYYDEDTTREDKRCYQSWITPVPVNAGDATLVFLEGSHKYHRNFSVEQELTSKDDWYKLSKEEVNIYTKEYNCELLRVKCPAGSMVIWDSRLIHCGQQPLKEREEPNFRFCFYVCIMPRELVTKANLKKRIRAFEELRLTSHNPIRAKLFSKKPRAYDDVKLETILPPAMPELTKLGRKLVGY